MRLIPKPDTLAISATSLGTAKTCLRKWAYRYIAKLPAKPGQWKDFGLVVHKIFERYYQDGAWPGDVCGAACPHWSPSFEQCWLAGAVTRAGSHCLYLKERQVASKMETALPYFRAHRFLTERKVYIETDHPGVVVMGIADLQAADAPYLWDFKTTGSLKYALSADELAADNAAIIYSQAYALLFGRYPELHWVYGQRDGKKVAEVKTYADMSQWDRIVNEAEVLLDLWRRQIPPEQMAATPRGCRDYGGCDYREVCPVSGAEQFRAYIEDQIAEQGGTMPDCIICGKPNTQIHITTFDGYRGPAHKACYNNLGTPEARMTAQTTPTNKLTEDQQQYMITWFKPHVEANGPYDAAVLRSCIEQQFQISDVSDEEINWLLFEINGQDPVACVPEAVPQYSAAVAALLDEMPAGQGPGAGGAWRKKDVKAKVIDAIANNRITTEEDIMAVHEARGWGLNDRAAAKRVLKEGLKAATSVPTVSSVPAAPLPPSTSPVQPNTASTVGDPSAQAPAVTSPPAAGAPVPTAIPQYASGPSTVGGSSVAPYVPAAPAQEAPVVPVGPSAATPAPKRTLYIDMHVEKGTGIAYAYEALRPIIDEYEAHIGCSYLAVDYNKGIIGLNDLIRKKVDLLPPEMIVLSGNWDYRIVHLLRTLYPAVYTGVSR